MNTPKAITEVAMPAAADAAPASTATTTAPAQNPATDATLAQLVNTVAEMKAALQAMQEGIRSGGLVAANNNSNAAAAGAASSGSATAGAPAAAPRTFSELVKSDASLAKYVSFTACVNAVCACCFFLSISWSSFSLCCSGCCSRCRKMHISTHPQTQTQTPAPPFYYCQL